MMCKGAFAVWESYEVSKEELEDLINNNQPISVSSDKFSPNIGVEVFSLEGGFYNTIYDANLGALRKINAKNPVFSSMPNRDIMLYNDMLLNPDINTIIVDGFFGTGKTSTVCAHLVTGLMNWMNGKEGISKAYISKPHESLGNSYGHLPGTLEEKTKEEFVSYIQYFERFGQPYLVDSLMYGDKNKGIPKMLEIMVFEYLRGRDIDQGWVILDEAQNTSVKEMSAFISRVSDNAKLIIIGDSNFTQLDRKGNTSKKNGLTFAKEVYRNKKYAGIIEMATKKHILRGQRLRDLYDALVS